MRTIDVQANQTILDIAVQEYGNVDAVPELLVLNPAISQDLSQPLAVQTMIVDETSPLVNRQELERLQEKSASPVSFVPVYDRLHRATQAFISAMNDDDATAMAAYLLPLDRLVRDLHGEPNIDHPTADLWDRLYQLYPVVGGTAALHGKDLVMNGELNVSGGGHDTFGMRMVTGAGIADLMDLSDYSPDEFCAGAYLPGLFIFIGLEGGAIAYYKNEALETSETYIGETAPGIAGKYDSYVDNGMVYQCVYAGFGITETDREILMHIIINFQKALKRL